MSARLDASADGNDARGSPAAPRLPIVAIGASAGGLEPLEALTRRLTNDGLAVVVLQHLAPGHESALAEILARDSSLKVVTIEDGMRVATNHIYVAPPGAEVALHQGVLRLMPPAVDHRGRTLIDSFFRSLAEDQGAAAIGVLLSGAGSDGSLGLKAIKEQGGITFVQEPSTARQPSMPQSALDAGVADYCLTPAEIGDELVRLAKHPYVAALSPVKVFDDDLRSKLFILLRRGFGVDFATYKQPTIERRIQRRMALHKLDRLEDYLQYVQANGAELGLLFSDLLIGVTGFFRDREPFEVLKSEVFPRLVEQRNPDVPIRVWVAGCSTGEEAFSIAMGLLEYLGDRAANHKVQIFATDVDEQALAKAREAIYPFSIEVDVAPERLQRFFSRGERGYQLLRPVRDMVLFARHNLGEDPPFSRIDLVSCRNVLIYMEPTLQKRVLQSLHYALNPDGFLLLGTSESVGESSDLFTLEDRKVKLYSKKHTARVATFDVALGTAPEARGPGARPAEHRPAATLIQIADRKVLEHYGPPGVVVNERLDILQYRGRTGRFFEPSPGIATVNLLKLARPDLMPELRSTLHQALTRNARVLSGPVRLRNGQEQCTVRLDVEPLSRPEAAEKTLLVLFKEQQAEAPSEPAPAPDGAADLHVQELERELAGTKEYLQATIDDLEAANEELQASNEELQSSNEELQSSNEELETSREELQSTNEELTTLNEELQKRMAQLGVTKDDLQNVLGATSAALVVVGMDLRIRRFSPAAERLFHLVPDDIGRSIAYIRTVIRARDIERTVSDAIEAVAVREQKVRCVDGRWYRMRISPYRTADRVIGGAVLELVNETDTERPAEALELGTVGRAILGALPQSLALVDDKMCVVWGNERFLALFRVGQDIFGRPFEDLWSGRADQPDLWKLLENAVTGGRGFERVATVKPFGQLDRRLRFSAYPIRDGTEGRALALVSIEETRVPGAEP